MRRCTVFDVNDDRNLEEVGEFPTRLRASRRTPNHVRWSCPGRFSDGAASGRFSKQASHTTLTSTRRWSSTQSRNSKRHNFVQWGTIRAPRFRLVNRGYVVANGLYSPCLSQSPRTRVSCPVSAAYYACRSSVSRERYPVFVLFRHVLQNAC